MFKGFLLTFCLHFVDIFGVDESLIACDMVEIIIFCMPYNMAKAWIREFLHSDSQNDG